MTAQTVAKSPDVTGTAPGTGATLSLRKYSELPEDGGPDVAAAIASWVASYLMRPHADLGRPGAVCPYTPTAARADLIRIGWSATRDQDEAYATMREAVRAFESLPCTRTQRAFRTVIVGFPHCADAEGVAMLKRVQNRLRPESIYRGKMIGLFEPNSPDHGLLNPNFHPLRSPLPLLAIRSLVENDAPFVLRNPRLAPIYLLKFPFTGPGKLVRQICL